MRLNSVLESCTLYLVTYVHTLNHMMFVGVTHRLAMKLPRVYATGDAECLEPVGSDPYD